MTILAYTDGASRGNPGESGIGVILKDAAGNILQSYFDYIGLATNNIAEYTALAACLNLVKKIECKQLIVHSDSELMVRQLNGQYKVKDEGLKKHYSNIKKILTVVPFEFSIKHIPREKNREADLLANQGIDLKKNHNSIVEKAGRWVQKQEAGVSGSRSIPRKRDGEESPNTLEQDASRIR